MMALNELKKHLLNDIKKTSHLSFKALREKALLKVQSKLHPKIQFVLSREADESSDQTNVDLIKNNNNEDVIINFHNGQIKKTNIRPLLYVDDPTILDDNGGDDENVALNLAGCKNAFQIVIPKNERKNIYIENTFDETATNHHIFQRLHFHLLENAHAVIHFISKGNNVINFTANQLITCRCDQNSTLTFFEGDQFLSTLLREIRVYLKSQAQCRWHFKELEKHTQLLYRRENIVFHLEEEKAEATITGSINAHESSEIYLTTKVHHHAATTTGNQLIKCIANDQAEIFYQGVVEINEHCSEANSSQINRNLILSNKAKIITSPILNVYHQDVTCTHGSSTGMMTEDEIFYLNSRGIKTKRALELMTEAFLFEVDQYYRGLEE